MFLLEIFNFSQKTAQKSYLGPSDPGCASASISYLQPAVNRQPGYRRGDREEVGRKNILNHVEMLPKWSCDHLKTI